MSDTITSSGNIQAPGVPKRISRQSSQSSVKSTARINAAERNLK